MKKITYEPDIEIRGRRLPINTNAEKQQGCFVHILKPIDGQLSAMLTHHSKVLVIRIDLHMACCTPDSRLLSKYLHKLKKALKRQLGLKRVGYVWARELERAFQQHYHLALLVNGNTIQLPHRVIALCTELWVDMGQPHPHYPENCAAMVKRTNAISYGDSFYRLSYLAKVRGKGYRAKSAKDYSTSQVKPKPKPKPKCQTLVPASRKRLA